MLSVHILPSSIWTMTPNAIITESQRKQYYMSCMTGGPVRKVNLLVWWLWGIRQHDIFSYCTLGGVVFPAHLPNGVHLKSQLHPFKTEQPSSPFAIATCPLLLPYSQSSFFSSDSSDVALIKYIFNLNFLRIRKNVSSITSSVTIHFQ